MLDFSKTKYMKGGVKQNEEAFYGSDLSLFDHLLTSIR